MAKLKLTVEIVIEELPETMRREIADCYCVPVNEIGTVSDINPEAIGTYIAANLKAYEEDLWAGSEMYARLGKVSVVDSIRE